jgi:hypothetical protein
LETVLCHSVTGGEIKLIFSREPHELRIQCL